MAKMFNISGSDVRVSISYGPCDDQQIFIVPPGESAEFQDGYCEPVKGAGVTVLPSIIARKSMVNGVPRMVPEAEVNSGRTRWQASVTAHHLAELARCAQAGLPAPEAPVELSRQPTQGKTAPKALEREEPELEDPFEPQVAETAADKRARVKAEKKAARAKG